MNCCVSGVIRGVKRCWKRGWTPWIRNESPAITAFYQVTEARYFIDLWVVAVHRNLAHRRRPPRACVRVIVYGLSIAERNKTLESLFLVVESRCPEISSLSDFSSNEIGLCASTWVQSVDVCSSVRLHLIIELRACFPDSMGFAVIIVVFRPIRIIKLWGWFESRMTMYSLQRVLLLIEN